MRPLVLLLALSGCATNPKVFYYPKLGITVIKASPDLVEEFCAAEEGFYDNGMPRPRYAKLNGCFDPATRQIWVKWDKAGTLVHELAHADGYTNFEASQIHWDDR